jgi:hypothetical protein
VCGYTMLLSVSHPLTGIDVYAHMSSSLYPGYSGLYGPRLATIYGTGLGIYRVLVHGHLSWYHGVWVYHASICEPPWSTTIYLSTWPLATVRATGCGYLYSDRGCCSWVPGGLLLVGKVLWLHPLSPTPWAHTHSPSPGTPPY